MTNQKELEQLPLLAAVDVEGAKAGSGSSSKPTVEDDSASTIAYLSVLYGLNDGIVKGFTQDGKLDADSLKKCVYLDGTAIMAADGTIQHDVEVAFREGTIDQTAIEGMPSVTVESVIGVTVRAGTPVARTFVRPEVSAYDVRISISRLMKNDDEGNSRKGNVEFAIDVATDSGSYAEYGRYSLNEKISQGFQRTYTVNVPKGNSRSIRVRKLTTDGDNTFTFNDIVLEAITEIVEVKLRYPHTTLLWLKYDARAFSSAPKLEVLLYGKADIRIPMNYDPDTRKYATTGVGTTNGVWNGQFKLGYTDNPVWHWYDIATSTRYGIGNRITDDIPNKFSLYSMAQYCDELVSDGKGGFEPRFTSNNMYLQSREDAYKVLKDMASVFRAKTLWDGQHLTPKMDVPRDAMLVFSRANCTNIAYSSISDAAQHNIIAVQYYDIDNMYASRYAYARSIENIQRRGRVEQADVTALGCTSEGQAQRMADYLLQCEMLENEIVTFTTGLDGIRPLIGDVFMFADDLIAGKATSGRVVSVDGNKVTLDRELNPTLDLEGTFVVNTTENLASTRKITAISDDKRTVTLESAITVTDITELVWAVKSKNVGLREFSVDDISYDAEAHSFNITGLLFRREKFTSSDNAANVVNPPYTVIDPDMPREPKTVTATYNSVVRQGINVSNIDVAWSQVTTAARYELEMRRDGGEWRKLGVTQSLTYEVENAYAGTYEFRVRSFDIRNKASRYTQSSPLVVAGKTLPPPVLDAFTVEGGLFSLNAKWSFPQGTEDTLSTRVKVTYSDPSTANAVVYTYDVAYPTNTLTLQNQTSGVYAWMQAAIVDRYGNEGAYTGWAVAQVSSDPDAVLDLLQGEIGKEYLTDALAEEIGKSAEAAQAARDAAAAANTANLAASNAAAAANNAKTAADDAKATAGDAKTAADNAKKAADAFASEANTRFDEVAEGFVTVRDEQGALSKRIDITDNGITEYKKTVNDQFIAYNDAFTSYSSKVDGSLSTLTNSTNTLAATTEAHTKALDTYTAKTDTMASNLATNYFTRTQTNEAVAAAITNLKLSTTYATVSAVSTLSGRVDKTETGISTLSSDLLSLKNNVANNYSTLTNNYYTKTAADEAAAGKVSEAVARLGDQSKKATLTFTESALKTLIKGNTTAPITISSESTAKVGSVGSLGQASGDSELMYMLPPEEAILIDPDKLYVLRYRFKRVSGTGGVYLGMQTLNAERSKSITAANAEASVNAFSSTHYVLSNVTPTLGVWQTGEYYFKGRSTGAATGSGTKASPRTLAAKAAYGRPMFWANYRAADSVVMCDYVEIECLDVDVSTLVTASALAATKAEIVKDYDGKITATVNDVLNLNTAIGNVKTDLTNNYYTKGTVDNAVSGAVTLAVARLALSSKKATLVFTAETLPKLFINNTDVPVSIAADTTARTGSKVIVGSGTGASECILAPQPEEAILYDPDKLYVLRYRYRVTSGAGGVYIGLSGLNVDRTKNVTSSNALRDITYLPVAHYAVGNAKPTAGAWQTGEYYFKGKSTGASSGAGTKESPRNVAAQVAYVRPLAWSSYGVLDTVTEFDYVEIECLDVDVDNFATAEAIKLTNAEVTRVNGEVVSAVKDISTLNTSVGNVKADLTNNYQTKSDATKAMNEATTSLNSRMDGISKGGTNLVNRWVLSSGYFSTSTGLPVGISSKEADQYSEAYLPCTAGDSYVATKVDETTTPSGTNARVAWYDKDKAFLRTTVIVNNATAAGTQIKLAAPANAEYMRYATLNPRDRVKLERGSAYSGWTAEDEAAWTESNTNKTAALLSTAVDTLRTDISTVDGKVTTAANKVTALEGRTKGDGTGNLLTDPSYNDPTQWAGTLKSLFVQRKANFDTSFAPTVFDYPALAAAYTYTGGTAGAYNGDFYHAYLPLTTGRTYSISGAVRRHTTNAKGTIQIQVLTSSSVNTTAIRFITLLSFDSAVNKSNFIRFDGKVTLAEGESQFCVRLRLQNDANGEVNINYLSLVDLRVEAEATSITKALDELKVNQSVTDGLVSNSATKLTNLEASFDGMQIGGSNLLPFTDTFGESWYVTRQYTTSTCTQDGKGVASFVLNDVGYTEWRLYYAFSSSKWGSRLVADPPIVKGRQYTLSAEFMAEDTYSASVVQPRLALRGQRASNYTEYVSGAKPVGTLKVNEWVKISFTGTVSEIYSDQVGWYIIARPLLASNLTLSAAVKVKVRRIQLEEGNVATSWGTSYLDAPVVDLSEYAKAGALSTLDARVVVAEGKITTQATSLEKLTTANGENKASLETQGKVINGLSASWTLKTDVNGYVAGFGTYNNGTTSEIVFRADKIAFANPTGTGKMYGFVYQASPITLANGTVIPAGLKVAEAAIGALDAKKLNVDSLSAITATFGSFTTYANPSQPTKGRMHNNGLTQTVYDDNNVLRLKLGKLN